MGTVLRALLIRVGIDHTYGGWNAPVDPLSRRFVYVPIPEQPWVGFKPGLERRYDEVLPSLTAFCDEFRIDPFADLGLPSSLMSYAMHLDPDFKTLTYGDRGERRGSRLRELTEDDLLVFYAGLCPVLPPRRPLVYALVGLYVVEKVLSICALPVSRHSENAHSRRLIPNESDIVVLAKRGMSGRFRRCLPVGEFRDRAYRVHQDILDAWGGLSVGGGYIQRSAVLPWFLDAGRFYEWFKRQDVGVTAQNN